MDKSEAMTVEMHDCLGAEYEQLDPRLGVAAQGLAARTA